MISTFKQFYESLFVKKTFEHKIGDVIFAKPNRKSSEKTRAVIKLYGNSGFIVCETNRGCLYREKASVKLLSRQHILKFNKKKGKIGRKVWLGWIPLEEITWIKKENRDF